jgi:hypothetical protein
MKLRTTIAGTGPGALVRVIGCGAMAIFASAAISACTGSTPSPSSSSSAASLAAGNSPTPNSTINFSANAGTTPATTAAESPTGSASPSAAAVAPSTQTNVAPATGGGGTAGLQDATLFIIGGAAVLAGAGGIAYHRRATRSR